MKLAILIICVVSKIILILTDVLLGLQRLHMNLQFLSVVRGLNQQSLVHG
jgi:hypothetical protein